MTEIRRRWQPSEDGAAKAAPFSLQVAISRILIIVRFASTRADSIAAWKKLSF
ncbi:MULTISPECIES: hypothetical protein [Rhizobium]|uniref:hypothetical protein n=1 Tax=Rhizobium TaxID=379 RepID=UPI0013DDD305|nr:MULTISPECIES: hypothetical protein [Rhizobium]